MDNSLLSYTIEGPTDRPHDELDWMVFIHGAGGSSLTWKHQAKAFREHFRLLLIDLRDHGFSKDLQPSYRSYSFEIVTDDVLRVLDHVGVTKAHFMSLSLGSIILQKLDERRPEVIQTMIMAGGVFKSRLADSDLRALRANFSATSSPSAGIYDGFILIVMPRKNHAFSRMMYRRQSKKLAPGEFLKWLGLYQDFFSVVRNFFNRDLRQPSLLVMGSQDHVFLDAARRYADKHERAEMAVMEGKGHLCNLEDREGV